MFAGLLFKTRSFIARAQMFLSSSPSFTHYFPAEIPLLLNYYFISVLLSSFNMSRVADQNGLSRLYNLRVPDQNGVSPLNIMLEIHHYGRKPSNYHCRDVPFWSETLDIISLQKSLLCISSLCRSPSFTLCSMAGVPLLYRISRREFLSYLLFRSSCRSP